MAIKLRRETEIIKEERKMAQQLLDPASVGVTLNAPGQPTTKGWEVVTPEMWEHRWSCFDKIQLPEPDFFSDPDWYVDVTVSLIKARIWEKNPEISPAELSTQGLEEYLDKQCILIRPYDMLIGAESSDGHAILWDVVSYPWMNLMAAWMLNKDRVYYWEDGKKINLDDEGYKLLENLSMSINSMFRTKQDMTDEEFQMYWCFPTPTSPMDVFRYMEPVNDTGLRANPDHDWWIPLGLGKLLDMKLEKQREYEKALKTAIGPKADKLRDQILNCKMTVRSTQAVQKWIKRMGAETKKAAPQMAEEKARQYAKEAAANLEWVAENPPRTFWEAMQLFWACLIAYFCLESRSHTVQFLPDRTFYPWYKKDVLEEKTFSRVKAGELVACFMTKYTEISGHMLRFGGGALGGQGTRDYSVWTLGGQDALGQNATTDLTQLFIDVQDGYRLHFPDFKYRWCNRTPRKDLKRVVEVMRSGMGSPSIRNDEIVIPSMMDMYPGEVSLEEARNWAVVGCNTPGMTTNSKGAVRRDAQYPQMTKSIEYVLFDGKDPEEGFEWFKTGVRTGDPTKFATWEEFYDAWLKQLEWILRSELRLRNMGMKRWGETCRRPFLSLLYEGCLKTGDDIVQYDQPRLSFQGNVGWVDTMDSLAAVKDQVYEKKKYTMAQLVEALKADWVGYDAMREDFKKSPKFGNDLDLVDDIFIKATNDTNKICRTNLDERGSPTFINNLPISLIYQVAHHMGALPDGRKRGEALADSGIAPHAQSDLSGPWARMRSAMKVDQTKWKAYIYNQKFDYPSVEGDAGLEKLMNYVETGLMGGMSQMQFNFLSRDILRDAQENPEKYPYLSVRVSGYTAFFTGLPKFVQDAVIDRVDHKL